MKTIIIITIKHSLTIIAFVKDIQHHTSLILWLVMDKLETELFFSRNTQHNNDNSWTPMIYIMISQTATFSKIIILVYLIFSFMEVLICG